MCVLGHSSLDLTSQSLSDRLMGPTVSAHFFLPVTLNQAYASKTLALALGRF